MYDFLYKIILTGDSGTGKSAILRRFADNKFIENYYSTIGVDFKVKTIDIGGKLTKLQVWDLAGDTRFRSMTASYYRGAHGIILVYDVTDRQSFASLVEWLEEVESRADPDAIRILVGNKIDNEHKAITTEEGHDFAKKHNLLFVECSAKNSINVDAVFSILISEIKQKQLINDASGDLFSMKKSIILHETQPMSTTKSPFDNLENCCSIF